MDYLKNGEILAPVGNWEMLIAAVRSGADAVYLGAKEFSARRNAENFTADELKKAIDYCHIRGVKVYLTLNILIKQTELEAAFCLARDSYNLGIDGIIIADLGLARILHEKLPDLPLHASTQMSVHSPSALYPLKELGFCRVVAAREMSKEELKKLCETANELGITIEAFVHGALCMCVSGQCLLSAFLGSRSGNRGLCAGACRLPFAADGGTGFDLSLKDLSLLDYIGELYEMGVRSFKIEGRMKRPEYVSAACVSARQALDTGSIEPYLKNTLKNVFSRQGFTSGYYNSSLGREMFGTRTKEDVVSANKAFPTLHELYRNERQSVGICVTARLKTDTPVMLTLFDGKNEVTVVGDIPSAAKTKAATNEDVEKNLTKFGATPFFAKNVDIALDDGLFISASTLNSLRREATEKLGQKRAAVHPPIDAKFCPTDFESLKSDCRKVFARFERNDQIPEDLSGIDGMVLALECEPFIPKGFTGLLAVDIPRGIISEDAIAKKIKLFRDNGFSTAFCGNLAAVEIAKKQDFDICADTGLNISNSESLVTAKKLGISLAVISPEELLCDTVKLASPIKKGIISYGRIPLMLTRNCPLKNGRSCNSCDKNGFITDRLGIRFPVRCRMGYSEVLNSVPLYLADRSYEYASLDFSVLYFTTEDKIKAAEIIELYKNNSSPAEKHTRGLYYRGTI